MNHITWKFAASSFLPYKYFLLRSSFWPPKIQRHPRSGLPLLNPKWENVIFFPVEQVENLFFSYWPIRSCKNEWCTYCKSVYMSVLRFTLPLHQKRHAWEYFCNTHVINFHTIKLVNSSELDPQIVWLHLLSIFISSFYENDPIALLQTDVSLQETP